MNKYFLAIIVIALFSLTGCGRFDRWIAGWTGNGVETCVDGVIYIQFTSGTTVKYLRDGKIATCP